MKFFTPELYEAYATAPPKMANEVEAEWDGVEEKYERRLAKLRPSLPDHVVELADKLCLHDAELLNLVSSPANADLWLHKDAVLFLLFYHLRAPIELSAPKRSKVFSEKQPRWLYDEIDMPRKGMFSHEVLFSDGRTMHMVFDRCSVHEIHPVGTAARLVAATKRMNGRGGASFDDVRRSLADVAAGRTQPKRGAIVSLGKRK